MQVMYKHSSHAVRMSVMPFPVYVAVLECVVVSTFC